MTICHVSQAMADHVTQSHLLTQPLLLFRIWTCSFYPAALRSLLYLVMSIKIVHKTQRITDAGKDMGYQGIMCTSMLNFHPDQSGDDAAA